jgi:DNA-binding NtrC family response regulator
MSASVKVKSGPVDAATSTAFGPSLEQASILVIDDEPGMRNFLRRTLETRCKRVETAEDTTAASRKLDENHFDLLILDNIMPGKTGVEWLAEQRAVGLFSDAILITAYADLETAIQALRAGASDFVLKPFRSNQILNAVARSLDRMQLRRENFVLRHELHSTSNYDLPEQLIGESKAIQNVRDKITRVAATSTSVLLTGQSGTGKEIAARSIHALSDRYNKPFIALNCATILPDRIESELFGHIKGAFKDTDAKRDGLFLHAEGGTMLLDEIGELTLPMQSKLLRVIEEGRMRPVGAEREVPIDLRFLFATNADLEKRVANGEFRADLYYRLNVLQIHLPPLCEREGDVHELAAMFMQRIGRQLRVLPVELSAAQKTQMERYNWPGNVRELRNLVERTLILGHFPDEFDTRKTVVHHAQDSLAEVERRHILTVLDDTRGNREKAARRLGISRKTIDRKCAQWDV